MGSNPVGLVPLEEEKVRALTHTKGNYEETARRQHLQAKERDFERNQCG